MKIKTRRYVSDDEKEEEQPLSPAARLFHAPEFNCNIISVIGLKCKIDQDVIIRGAKQTVIMHPRFSSKLMGDGENGQNQRWVRTKVVVEDHIIVPKIKQKNIENADAFLEDYVSDIMKIPLDTSKPLWELHLLDLKTSEAENVSIIKIHHSIGDGMSIMSVLLACMRKTSNPDELPSLPIHKRSSSRSSRFITGSISISRLWWLVKLMWTAVMLVFNTVCDGLEFIFTTLFYKDTDTPIKGEFRSRNSKPLRLVHRTVSLDDIKLIKNAMKMTVNDVVLGVTQAGLSRYLERKYRGEESNRKKRSLHKRIRLRGALLVNLRPTTGIQELADMMKKGSKCRWGNCFGYVIFPFSIASRTDPLEHLKRAQKTITRKKNSYGAMLTYIFCVIIVKSLGIQELADMMEKGSKCRWGNCFGYVIFPFSIASRTDPLEHLKRAQKTITRKKNSYGAMLTYIFCVIIVKSLGIQVAAIVIKRIVSNTTMTFSNMVGPVEEVSFYGHPITYFATSAYGHPHALTVHCQSYMDKMTITMIVDPTVISDPHRLCDDLEESLESIKAAVQKRGSLSLCDHLSKRMAWIRYRLL